MKLSSETERQLITREFADTVTGKQPAPYLRTHDHVQNALAEHAAATQGESLANTAYLDRMIHFWREVSLAELPRCGIGMDECYSLLFESAFELGESDPEWAVECLDDKGRSEWPTAGLATLARRMPPGPIEHDALRDVFASIYAPRREQDPRWRNQYTMASTGDMWFWAGLVAAAGIDELHFVWNFRVALAESSTREWGDSRLHTRLIREAPIRATITPLRTLMAHPIIRLGELKYPETLEQTLLLRFLNARCIAEGIESEEDSFKSPLRLGQWVRDARSWAEAIIKEQPQTYSALLLEAGNPAVERCRSFFDECLGRNIKEDSIDVTLALLECANRMRGFEVSWYRAQLWEVVVHVVDMALWLGWIYPRAAADHKTEFVSAA